MLQKWMSGDAVDDERFGPQGHQRLKVCSRGMCGFLPSGGLKLEPYWWVKRRTIEEKGNLPAKKVVCPRQKQVSASLLA